MFRISRHTVSQRSFKLRPDKFIRVEFRSVPRKPKRPDAGMLGQELIDCFRPMNGTAIPHQDKTPAHMPTQIAQKLHNISRTNIFIPMKPYIERHPFSFRRYANGGNCRNLTPASRASQQGGLATWCPCPANGRHKRKPALIKEYQWDATFLRVFLYATIRLPSIVRWLSHFFPWLAFPVSDNSIPSQLEFSKYDWDDTKRPAFFRLFRPRGASSINPWSSRNEALLSANGLQSFCFERRSTSLAVPERVSRPNLVHRLFHAFASRERRNSLNCRLSWRQPTYSSRFAAMQWLGVADVRGIADCHGVSCKQYTTFPLLMRSSIV
jgi:hypothetical protein